jgi:hypothetical protein
VKKKLETSNIYSSTQLELKYKQQINNFFKKKSQQSDMSFSLSSSNTSSTLMKSLKDETFCTLPNPHASLGQFLVIIISQSRFSIPSLDRRKLVMTLARLKIHLVSI